MSADSRERRSCGYNLQMVRGTLGLCCALSILAGAIACGDDDSGGDADSAPPLDAPSSIDAVACVADEECDANPGDPCRTGRTDCSTGEPVCVPGFPVTDGTACPDGTCQRGVCATPITIDGDVDLSVDTLVGNRTCAESPSYSVTSLSASAAVLSEAPADDCLQIGDEVMLINMQGAPGQTDAVGVWELLFVASVDGAEIAFESAKTRSYGADGASDTGIGVGATDQKVVLLRVAQLGDVTVADVGTVTAGKWNGLAGGVLAVRASSIAVSGEIHMRSRGYREGQWSIGDSICNDSVHTESGESIAGPGAIDTARNAGGSGGITGAIGASYLNNVPLCASPGHATAGEPGANGGVRTVGEPGSAYGVGDASKLTMGSGSGGGVACGLDVGVPAELRKRDDLSGGIVALFVDSLTVEATGGISASSAARADRTAGAGGYVLIRGTDAALGTQQVTALGSLGEVDNSAGIDATNKASDGFIVIDASGTVTGETAPAANEL